MAKEVCVIGEFNNWNPGSHLMKKIDDSGVYEIFVEGAKDYQSYKYHILTCEGKYVDKQDPFGVFGEYRPGSCSRLFNIENFIWHYDAYLKQRTRNFDKAMSIYELHVGSWLDKPENRFLSY